MGFPNTPSNGQTAVVNGITYTYNSARTAWVRSAATTYNLYTASNIAPTTPSLGDQWYYIATDVLYEYVSDGTNSVWVDIGTFAGQNGNITALPSTTLTGNIVVGLNNVYSIGAANGYLDKIYANNIVGNTITTGTSSGNLTIPGINVTYITTTTVTTSNGVFWSNGTSFSSPPGGTNGQFQFNNSNAFGGANVLFTSANGNVTITSLTSSSSKTTGALVVGGGVGVSGSVYTDAVYTATGVYWSGNSAAFASAPGGTTGQMQYNSSSTFAGAANVKYDSTTGNLVILSTTNGTATGGALTALGGASFVGNIFVTGNLLATNQIIAAYSDERLKNRLGAILNPVQKVQQIDTFYYTPNDLALSIGINDTRVQVGVSAQSVESVFPEVVTSSPISSEYKTVSYERLVPLLIAAITEQQEQIDQLKEIVNVLQNR